MCHISNVTVIAACSLSDYFENKLPNKSIEKSLVIDESKLKNTISAYEFLLGADGYINTVISTTADYDFLACSFIVSKFITKPKTSKGMIRILSVNASLHMKNAIEKTVRILAMKTDSVHLNTKNTAHIPKTFAQQTQQLINEIEIKLNHKKLDLIFVNIPGNLCNITCMIALLFHINVTDKPNILRINLKYLDYVLNLLLLLYDHIEPVLFPWCFTGTQHMYLYFDKKKEQKTTDTIPNLLLSKCESGEYFVGTTIANNETVLVFKQQFYEKIQKYIDSCYIAMIPDPSVWKDQMF
jgi:CxxC motif-containing protein